MAPTESAVRPAATAPEVQRTSGVPFVRTLLWVGVLAGGGSAAVLWCLRASGAFQPQVAEVTAFSPLGLPAALVGLVCAVVLGWRRRPAPLLAALACAALVAAHAWWQAPLFTGPRPAAGPDTFVVATQNIEFGDPDALVALVEKHHVDVLVLTEANQDRMDALRGAGLGRLLPRNTDSSRGTTVLSRFPLVEKVAPPDGGGARVVTATVPGIGPVDVVAMHPTPPYKAQRWATDWRLLLDALTSTYGAGVGSPTVVAGDLNATLDHAPLRSLLDLGFSDAAEATNAGWAPTWPADGSRGVLGLTAPPLLALDHVLTGGGLVPASFEVDESVGSDHAAVVSTLGLGT